MARDGYVNLLVSHQRRRRTPGDTAQMVSARRAFLDRGWYSRLQEAITEVTRPTRDMHVLDVGCGEGYYTRAWPSTVWGIDIAKAAVRLAARRGGPRHHYAVASAYDVPLADTAIDVVVNVFAPLHTDELERVLKPSSGLAVVVTPGPDHLAGLAALLFDSVEPHPTDPPFHRANADTQRIRYEVTIDNPRDLLLMTPYAWYVSPERRGQVSALKELSTPVDFLITTYRP